MIEKWIPGYEGKYSITEDGKVFTHIDNYHRKIEPRERKIVDGGNRYLSINFGFHKKGKKTRWYIHELLLLTFVGPRPEGMVARHLNDNPRDNRLENLAWGTKKENTKDALKNNPEWGKWNNKYSYPYKKVCDICGKEKKLPFSGYYKNTKELSEIYTCSEKCGIIKRNETNLG